MPMWGSRGNQLKNSLSRNNNLVSSLFKVNSEDGSIPILNELGKTNVVFTGTTNITNSIISGNLVLSGATEYTGYLMDVSGDFNALEIYEDGSRVATIDYVDESIALITGNTLSSLTELANIISNFDPSFAEVIELRIDDVDLSINYLRYTTTQQTYDSGTLTTTVGNNLVLGTNASSVILVKGQTTINDKLTVSGDVSFNSRFFFRK